jgi:hypothetical protein
MSQLATVEVPIADVRVKLLNDESDESDLLKLFDDGDFFDSTLVRIGFRTVQSSAKHPEHPANSWAAYLTARSSDEAPGGQFCHAELLIQIRENVWYKASVSKKRFINGKWLPGCVHMMRSDPAEWKSKYVFLGIFSDRGSIRKMLEFLQMQNQGPFNPASYYGALTPLPLGVRHFNANMMRRQYAGGFFCTELIVCALQCLVQHSRHINEDPKCWQTIIQNQTACRSNPNLLYRILVTSYGVSHAFRPNETQIGVL